MNLLEIVAQVRQHLEQNGRVSYRMLRRQFELDEDGLEDLIEELVDIQGVAVREERALAWSGDAVEAAPAATPERDPRSYTPKHLADKILHSKSALEGERKQVTVLFADVKGSTELAEELDPEEWHAILDRFFQILTSGVHRFEGTVNQYTGDGIMALFGAPIAHEDHAQRACYAALLLRDEVRKYADELRVERGLNFGVRIGLNSGDVVVGKIGDDLRMDYTAQGHTVALAQRMEALAESGRICIAENTARLVEGYLELSDLGRASVRGAREPVGMFELVGVGSIRTRLDVSRARGFSRFIGRADDLATLHAALERALEGQGRVVGVVAEAGVGKSRLCLEFAESCRRKDIAVYEAHCPAHGKTVPLLPIFEIFRAYFAIGEGDHGQVAREKIAGRLLLLDRAFEADLPIVWEFLGVPDPARPAPEADPRLRQRQLFAWVRRLVHARSQREPAVLLFDDLHWIDAGSDAFIAELVEAVDSTRTLLLLNFRPEYGAPWMQQRAYYQQLPLTPLGPDAIRALARDLLGPDPSVSELPETIAERTGGNPFFTEEIVQALDESGHLLGTRGGYTLGTPIERIDVPTNVRATLAARIDRLAEREKHVLQTAAIIGKEFSDTLLREVVEVRDEGLAEALSVLRGGEFLYERALYPTLEHAFKHPLTQEVAYDSQLAQRRQPLHAAVARAIEAQEPERVEENAALLAYHWDAAADVEQAARWHARAAAAIEVVDFREASRHVVRLRELVDLLPDSPDQRARAVTVRGKLLTYQARGVLGASLEDAGQLLREAEGLAGEDVRSLARARFGYGYYCLYHGREQEGVEQLERAMMDADRVGELELRLATRWPLSIAAILLGEFERGIEIASEGIEIGKDEPDLTSPLLGWCPFPVLLGIRGAIYALQGRLEEASRDIEWFLELGGGQQEVSTRDFSFQVGIPFAATLHQLTGDRGAALAVLRPSVDAMEQAGILAGSLFARHQLGIAHALNEEWREACTAFEAVHAGTLESQVFLLQDAKTLAWIARARLELGELDAARAALSDAFAAAERIGTREPLPHAYLVDARLRMRSSGTTAAREIDAALAAAREHAQRIGARLWEPFIELGQAEWEQVRGDEAGRKAAVREAERLLRDMGASAHADRIAREHGV